MPLHSLSPARFDWVAPSSRAATRDSATLLKWATCLAPWQLGSHHGSDLPAPASGKLYYPGSVHTSFVKQIKLLIISLVFTTNHFVVSSWYQYHHNLISWTIFNDYTKTNMRCLFSIQNYQYFIFDSSVHPPNFWYKEWYLSQSCRGLCSRVTCSHTAADHLHYPKQVSWDSQHSKLLPPFCCLNEHTVTYTSFQWLQPPACFWSSGGWSL